MHLSCFLDVFTCQFGRKLEMCGFSPEKAFLSGHHVDSRGDSRYLKASGSFIVLPLMLSEAFSKGSLFVGFELS